MSGGATSTSTWSIPEAAEATAAASGAASAAPAFIFQLPAIRGRRSGCTRTTLPPRTGQGATGLRAMPVRERANRQDAKSAKRIGFEIPLLGVLCVLAVGFLLPSQGVLLRLTCRRSASMSLSHHGSKTVVIASDH